MYGAKYYKSETLNDIICVLDEDSTAPMERYKVRSLRSHIEFGISHHDVVTCLDEEITEDDVGLEILSLMDEESLFDRASTICKRLSYCIEKDKWNHAVGCALELQALTSLGLPDSASKAIYHNHITPEQQAKKNEYCNRNTR